MATIGNVVCNPTPAIGPGGSNELQRFVIDTTRFPDALCNDGTPAVFSFRPAANVANRNKWVINLHGGGSCNSASTCLARWCSCDSLARCPFVQAPTNFNRLTMTNLGPDSTPGAGIFERPTLATPNPVGDSNQVILEYCSSDTWLGRQRAVAFSGTNPKTNAPENFTMHFLGAAIVDAALATLRRDGVPTLSYGFSTPATPMPDLDDATEVLFNGDSAGGFGLVSSLDELATTLRANNTGCQGAACPLKVYGLLDAMVAPERRPLDFSNFVDPTVRSYDAYVASVATNPSFIDARRDASCMSWHRTNQPGTEAICVDESHVLRHHVTTPFFVRAALADVLISGLYIESGMREPGADAGMTVASFARRLYREVSTFERLSSTAEEGSAFTRQPGVFAPLCVKHDTIHSTVQTFGTTITTDAGVTVRLLDAYSNWVDGGTPSNVLTQTLNGSDTVCPP